MDFDYAHYMLTEGRKGKENPVSSSPSREAYRKHLAETFNMNRSRILAFKNKPPAPVETFPREFASAPLEKVAKSRRHIPQVGSHFQFDLILMLSFATRELLMLTLILVVCSLLSGHWMLLISWMITT